jgi:uncharacterized OB-fold protein
MSLITCKECGHNVSKSAASCPNCGASIGSKSLKSQTQLSVIAIIIGLVWSIYAASSESGSIVPVVLLLGGFMWFVLCRLRR